MNKNLVFLAVLFSSAVVSAKDAAPVTLVNRVANSVEAAVVAVAPRFMSGVDRDLSCDGIYTSTQPEVVVAPVATSRLQQAYATVLANKKMAAGIAVVGTAVAVTAYNLFVATPVSTDVNEEIIG